MTVIGIIGGTSWESSALYYKLINESVRDKFGGLNSVHLLLRSLNYQEVVDYEQKNNWQAVSTILVETAKQLERGGASFLLLACNTLHKVAPDLERAVKIPFLHIADGAGEKAQSEGMKKVGLLGTQYTMEEGFYSRRLSEKYGLSVLTPELESRERMDSLIYNELCVGKFLDSSRREMAHMIQSMVRDGAEAIILGCTELGMILRPEDSSVPLFDTTVLHVQKAVELYTL